MGFRFVWPDEMEKEMVDNSDTKYSLCIVGEGGLPFVSELEHLFFAPGTPEEKDFTYAFNFDNGVWINWIIIPRNDKNLRRLVYVARKLGVSGMIGSLVTDLYPELKRELTKAINPTSFEELLEEQTKTRRISSKVQKEVWERDGGRCVACGSSENLHYDHIIPFSKGGDNSVDNIQILCRSCNLSKGAKIGGEE